MQGRDEHLMESPGRGRATTLRLCLLIALGVAACDRGSAVTQPIAFNHQLHVEMGLDCTYCHESVEKAPAAGVPSLDTCVMCHAPSDEAAGEDCEDCDDGGGEETDLQRLKGYGARGEPVPWRRIYELPDHVYFSHRRHVTVAEVGCAECHGDVPSLAAPAPRPLVDHDMDWCLGCHVARGATTDCIHCHR